MEPLWSCNRTEVRRDRCELVPRFEGSLLGETSSARRRRVRLSSRRIRNFASSGSPGRGTTCGSTTPIASWPRSSASWPHGQRAECRQWRSHSICTARRDRSRLRTPPRRRVSVRNVQFVRRSAYSGAYPGDEKVPICRVLGALPGPSSKPVTSRDRLRARAGPRERT